MVSIIALNEESTVNISTRLMHRAQPMAVLCLLLMFSGTRPCPAQDTLDSAVEAVVGKPIFGKPVRLFNGTNLDGWSAFLQGGSTDIEGTWSVADGIISCEGNPIGYLYTDTQYTNYELQLEWRFDPERGAGNSGVLLRMVGKHTVWPKSIEAQLHSRNAGDIWNIGHVQVKLAEERTQGRRTRKMHETNEKPLGEWNRYRILLDGGNLVLEVNGLVQNTGVDCAEVSGRIGLQSEGAAIQFRNIRLRPIVGHE